MCVEANTPMILDMFDYFKVTIRVRPYPRLQVTNDIVAKGVSNFVASLLLIYINSLIVLPRYL